MASYAESNMTMDLHSTDLCASLERNGDLTACSASPEG